MSEGGTVEKNHQKMIDLIKRLNLEVRVLESELAKECEETKITAKIIQD
jgi:hypothetical protein